ncbi:MULTISPECIES: ArsR family transcriptional regulator [unclassified Streptomyces]|uniref:ArsR family transcriptional regulator n=1 Tax=unclassified Streptomyces TaxID=2593676 RepID=UPI0029665820|nr:ArsR family transcriptional regulator [Streptomyces sp. SJL17-1]
MIEISLTTSEHGTHAGSLRIADSRLWETFGSIGLLSAYRGLVPWPYTNWGRAARRSLLRADVTLPGWLVHLFRAGGGTLPSFLLPVPSSARQPDLADEIASLREVDPARVREELERWFPQGVPAEVRPLYADPAARIADLCAFLPRYVRAALAPYEASLRTVTDDDILLRARVLATQGPDRLLGTLNGAISRRGDVLRLHAGPPGRIAAKTDVSRIVLVPLVFGRGASLLGFAPNGVTAVSYQAEGAAVLACEIRPGRRAGRRADEGADEPARGDRLEILLGRSRAGVVRGLVAPTTTSDLAVTLGLAPSTVSEHLTSLVAAGVVRRRRAGVRVLYELDASGVALLRHLDNRRRVNAPSYETT